MLAVGEGPNAWTDFFTQQLRWSRGTYETILKQYWKGLFTLPPGKLFNYTMMIIFYPMSALNWILAALSCALFLGLGASGVQIDPTIWMMLYGNASALQIGLYVWNRRHNVSPHEPEGSGGLAGMVMSALSAPIYARSLIDAVLRRKSKFVVTPKGDSASPDTLFGTFRIHLFFILVFGGSLGGSFYLGHDHPAMLTWAALALLITAAPIIAWRVHAYGRRRRSAKAARGAAGIGRAGPHSAPRPPRATDSDGSRSTDQTMQIALGGREKMKYRPSRRTRRTRDRRGGGARVSPGSTGPCCTASASEKYHDYKINKPEYKAENGHWDIVDVPEKYRINTIHAALLHTGKVLLVAGSGQQRRSNFDAKTFDTVLWDPVKNTFKNIPTPNDLFCAGHTQLPDGKLLVAGGTQRYEKLKGDVKKAGGLMIVHNENPDSAKTLTAGTIHRQGERQDLRRQGPRPRPARQEEVFDPATGQVPAQRPRASAGSMSRRAKRGKKYETGTEDNYRVQGLTGADARNIYGIAQKLSLDKKDFQGIKDAYEFDPVAEKLHQGRPDERGPLVPDADHAGGRQGPVRLRPRRHRPDRPRQERDLRPEDQEVGVHAPDSGTSRPIRRCILTDGQRDLLLGRQRRIRPGRQGPYTRPLGPGDQQVQQDPGTERPGRAGDRRVRAAAARAGPASSW